MKSIADAYTSEAPELLPFFQGPASGVFASPLPARDWNEVLRYEIAEYQSDLGLERLVTGHETLVVTGQQPALFCGPLYTVYKAITAIRLAARLEEERQSCVRPLFWIGSDDHDFAEAQTVVLLGKSHRPVHLVYEPEKLPDATPLYRVPLDATLHTLIDRAANETTGSEFREEIRAFLHESLDVARSFADWSARILARLFRDTPLLFFEPRLPAARRIAASIIERELVQPLETTRLLNQAGESLRKLGFTPQLVKNLDECSFFIEIDGRRCKVLYRNGEFVLPEEDKAYSPETLNEWLEEAPGRFSPNVALRCIVQQTLFPCAAYVAGPGEIAYWAQLKAVFERFGTPMPTVFPRAAAVLKTAKTDKLLQRFALSVADLAGGPEPLLERTLKQGVRSPALDLLHERRVDFYRSVESLVDALGCVSRGAIFARDQGERFLCRVKGEWERMESALLHEDAAQVESMERQLVRLCDTLAPGRKPQERVYSVFSFLFEHGWDLVPRLMGALDIESFKLNEVEL